MKTPELIALERKRADLIADARSILDEIRDCKDAKTATELERRHDAAMREIDANKLDIDEQRTNDEIEAARVANRPSLGGAGEVWGDDSARTGSGKSIWLDSRGQEVKVYAPGERMASRKYDGPGVGDIARAMIYGPRDDVERRALNEGTDSAGGYTVPEKLAAEWIDRLRAKTVVTQAGARTVMMESDNLNIARVATDPTVTWTAENAETTASDPTFESVRLSPVKLTTLVKVSREVLEDSVNIADILDTAIMNAMAVEMDRAFLFGSGASNEPTGLFNIAGINSKSMGTNGATPSSYDELCDAVYEVLLDNADYPKHAIMHPRTWVTYNKLKDGNGMPLVSPPMLQQIKSLMTTAVPITQTQGTASGVCSTVLLGDFSRFMIGMRTSVQLKRLEERYAEFDQVGFYARVRVDCDVTNPSHFCKVIGIKP